MRHGLSIKVRLTANFFDRVLNFGDRPFDFVIRNLVFHRGKLLDRILGRIHKRAKSGDLLRDRRVAGGI
jgi:hypothetical protein